MVSISAGTSTDVCEICDAFVNFDPRSSMSRRRQKISYQNPCLLEKYEWAYFHQPNLVALKDSADAGCQVCQLMLDCLEISDHIDAIFDEERKLELRMFKDSRDVQSKVDDTEAEEFVGKAFRQIIYEKAQDRRASNWRGSEYNKKFPYDEWNHRGRLDGPIVLLSGRVTSLQNASLFSSHLSDDGKSGSPSIISDLEVNGKKVYQIEVRVSCSAFTEFDQTGGLWGILEAHISTEDDIDPELEHRPSRKVLSDPHLNLIRHWRLECQAKHQACNKRSLENKLPTRVIEIMSTGREVTNVRVVETYDLKGNHEYACLSYCWGSAKQASSTTTSSFPREIAITDLPKTISDAIWLCYALKIRYLWVDSMCIIQGDASDWQRESAKMCDTYGRSALTIATEICATSTQSFADQRKESNYFSGPRTMLKDADQPLSPRKSIWFREKDSRQKSSPWAAEVAWNVLNYFNTDEQTKVWRTRAWTFQEWMISPRVLHIDEMTLWHCFEGYGNEVGQRTMAPVILHRNILANTNEIMWKDIVRNYTARKLTNDTDRLPALDGIVQLYQERIGHTYLAGLWLEEMPKSLLWRRRAQDSKRSSGFNKGLIPSWSWASVETMVHEEMFNWDCVYTTVRSYVYKCEPPESLSHIREAWLELEGPLIRVMSCKRAAPRTSGG
ncbi:hypothetical protein HG530_015280 [Fusarium avenaceum]|nr:hypothetical protein HG530_015280 [Fusarium avenaceum]